MKDRDRVLVRKMIVEINDIDAFVRGLNCDTFLVNKIVQKAVAMSLINIGELSANFSDEYRQVTSAIPWSKVKGLRNLAAHNYHGLNMSNIWETIERDLPDLKQTLQRSLAKERSSSIER